MPRRNSNVHTGDNEPHVTATETFERRMREEWRQLKRGRRIRYETEPTINEGNTTS